VRGADEDEDGDIDAARGTVVDVGAARGVGWGAGAVHGTSWGTGVVCGMAAVSKVSATEEG
jgi:hypothetical protein